MVVQCWLQVLQQLGSRMWDDYQPSLVTLSPDATASQDTDPMQMLADAGSSYLLVDWQMLAPPTYWLIGRC